MAAPRLPARPVAERRHDALLDRQPAGSIRFPVFGPREYHMSATLVRPEWGSLPAAARDYVESRLESRVAGPVPCTGGFTPGVASRLLLDDDRRVFLRSRLVWC